MGLGKELQGLPNKIEATSNKGKAGLGLGDTHPLTLSTTPDYTPRPDTAILTHDHAALSFEEIEWWRIMQQRKPAKLLRSKFLPQDDILLAMRTARETSHAWHKGQADVSDEVPDQAMVGSMVSSAEGDWVTPLLTPTPQSDNASLSADATSQSLRAAPGSPRAGPITPRAAPNSPSAFCLHQAPCVAPHGPQHSRSFWNMASLDSAFNICSSLAAMQQSGSTADADLCLLDLSMEDCGATEYVLTHGGVRVQSAQVLLSEAAEKLQGSGSSAVGVVQALSPSTAAENVDSVMQAASAASSNQSQDSTRAQTDLMVPKPMQAGGVSTTAAAMGSAGMQLTNLAAVAPLGVASLPDSPAAELDPTRAAQSAYNAAKPLYTTDAIATDSTHVQAAAPDAVKEQHSRTPQLSVATSAAYNLHSYEAMKASLKGAHLVIGSLGSPKGQNLVPNERETPQAKGSSAGQLIEVSGQDLPTAQKGNIQHEGVMEAEYADSYRARLLWECALALSCLHPGMTLLPGYIMTQYNRAHSDVFFVAAFVAQMLTHVWYT